MFRCVNLIFGYCKGKPSWTKEPTSGNDGVPFAGVCGKDHATCKKYKTSTESVEKA